ncbi:MAG: FtsK/SpoIIIE domain-containing protein, partial [Acidimicrobiaceae bacterium]|nr:FtsK/SpoIIIE domain-containing protein [Acidimicrobiaceae bacterium]
VELESMEHPETPPTLLLVVDEFAALAREVPEFIEGVVDVALRGRSLGIHLLLATQRPAGVVTPQIRANTSLRIALRVADDDDSVDVIGSNAAASLPSEVPGRAIAKIGPRASALFQSAYAGGFTQAEAGGPKVVVLRLAFDRSTPLDPDGDRRLPQSSEGATDLQRLVDNVVLAHERAGLDAPRRPWQPPLASVYDLARLPLPETDEKIVIGVVDMPRRQRQTIAHFVPDRDGSALVLGASGSGKTVLLRTLAAAAGMSKAGPTCHVYGLDFAGRGLEMLGDLPQVGTIVQGHDNERVVRLLRDLRSRIAERSERFAAARAGSLPEYRASGAGRSDEPRLLVLLDGYAAFHSVYERVEGGKWIDWLTQLVADGRQFGVHFVMTADRRSAFPLALTSAVGSRVVLRLAHPDEYSAAGVPLDMIAATSVPGRAVLDGFETQVALLGGEVGGDDQTQAMTELGQYLQPRLGAPVPPVRILPEQLRMSSIPRAPDGFALGVRDDDLAPAVLRFEPGGFIVAGPPRAGKTTALHALVASAPPTVEGVVVVAPRDSSLTASAPGVRVAVGEEAAAGLLREVSEGSDRNLLIVVDDLHDFVNSDFEQVLGTVLRSARDRGWMVAASASAEAVRRAYDGSLRDVRANKAGILLQPDSEVDGEIVGVRLPRAVGAVWPRGRGYLVAGGVYELCQVAVVE